MQQDPQGRRGRRHCRHGQGQARHGAARVRRRAACSSRASTCVKKHQRPNPMKGVTGRHRRQGRCRSHVSNVALSTRRPARPTASASSTLEGRPQGARLQVERRTGRRVSGDRTRWPRQPGCRSIYRERSSPKLSTKFGYKSVMQVPRITKITLNMGVGEAVADKKVLDNAVADLTKIAGQKPVVTKAQEVDRELQDPRRLPDRLHGDAARRAHVRVPRPPGHRRVAARPRLPRHLRRARSTAAATTTSASRNRSSSPRSSTTRSTRSAGMNITITTTAKTDDEAQALLDGVPFPVQELKDSHGQDCHDQPRDEARASW